MAAAMKGEIGMEAARSRKIALVVAAVAALLACARPARAADDCAYVPQPDFRFAPAPVEAGYAGGFAGIWQGVWAIRLGDRGYRRHEISCARLYVSVEDAQHAVVTYCHAAPRGRKVVGHCRRVSPQLTGNRLAFTTRSGLNYTFTLTDGVLEGAFVDLGEMSSALPRYATFHRLR
jgi:hypothetical protein